MESFPAKILLFGEYTIIKGSAALAMPLELYGGVWKFVANRQNIGELQQSLPALCSYLENLNQTGDLLAALDLISFRKELSEGLYFASTIPGGYGAGSSGALCAAIYSRYILTPLQEYDLFELKKELAQIESYFHGSSSGIDPLVCFLQVPLHIVNKEMLMPVDLPKPPSPGPVFFLLNTQISRKTEPLVNIFLNKCNQDDFSIQCLSLLIDNNNKAIASFLSGNWDQLLLYFRAISDLQSVYFEEMIPLPFRGAWAKGLAGNDFALKLCGAGGGGFILGYGRNWEVIQQELEGFEIQRLRWL